MTKKDSKKFQSKLEDEAKILEKELRATGSKSSEHPGEWNARPNDIDVLRADESETADKLESYEENESLLSEFGKRHKEVKDALERIKNDTYGVCRICGKPIEKERLEANPAADTCIAHKDK